MIFLPVAEREAREACRQKRTYHWRWIVAALALVVMTLAYFATRGQWNMGKLLFVPVSITAFIYCLFAGALRTADTIAEEKRENTLGLLFLTDLKTTDILIGKLVASSVNCVFGVVAMVPILAIPMLMGGVDSALFGKMTLTLFNTLFLSISWGFLISALLRTATATVAAAMLAAIFWSAGVMMVAVFVHEEMRARSVSWIIALFSPINPMLGAFHARDPILSFWGSTVTNHLMAWLNFGLALYFLPRLWQETPKSKKIEQIKARIRDFRFGTAGAKAKFRQHLLGQNPIYWLANRERISSSGLLILITLLLGTALIIGFAIITARPTRVEEMGVLFIGAVVVVHALIAFRLAASACYRLAEDRRSGALELILATSISIRDVMRGQWKALGRQFFGPIAIVQVAHIFALVMMVMMWFRNGFAGSDSIWGAFVTALKNPLNFDDMPAAAGLGITLLIMISIAVVLTLNWIAIGWVGMWLGLRFKRPAAALGTTLALVLVPPWAILIASLIAAGEAGVFRSIDERVLFQFFFSYGWVLALGNIILLTRWARRSLYSSFREAASDRFSDVRRPFPWHALWRFALRTAGVCGGILIAYLASRAYVDRRGERAWATVVTTHKDFSLVQPAFKATPIEENLATAPILTTLISSAQNGGGVNQIPGMWTFHPMNPGNPTWNWTIGNRTEFTALEAAFHSSRVISAKSSTPAASVLDAFARAYDKALDELDVEARQRPVVQFPRHDAPIPSWGFYRDVRGEARPVISMLAVKATARAAAGDLGALRDIHLALRLVEGWRDDPSRIMIRCESALDVIQAVFELIATEKLSEADLASLQGVFERMDLLTAFDEFRGNWIRQVIRSGDEIVAGRRQSKGASSPLAGILPIGFVRNEQARLLQYGLVDMRECVDLTNRVVSPEAAGRIKRTRPLTYVEQHDGFDDFLRTLRAVAFTQTAVDQVALACALERYRLAHGEYPKRLDEIAPAYIARVPHDIMSGKPLRFERDADKTYRLWSVAWDGVDNNGSPTATMNGYTFWNDQDRGDWVWFSRPRTSQER